MNGKKSAPQRAIRIGKDGLAKSRPGQRSGVTGKGRSSPISNSKQAHTKSSRSSKFKVNIPDGVTGTGEQAS